MDWINARITFPKRRAQLVVVDDDLSALLLRAARDNTLATLEQMCQILCDGIAEGRYEGATLHALAFDAARWCWVLGFSHPSLGAVAPGMQAPEILLDLVGFPRQRLLAFLGAQMPANLQGQDRPLDRLDAAQQVANEVPTTAPSVATELGELGEVAARQAHPNDVEERL
jgi:hypothetical protein